MFVATIKKWLPLSLIVIGGLIASRPLISFTPYQNYFFAFGLVLICTAWFVANLLNRSQLQAQGRWPQQKQAMIAMGICMAMGLGLLSYYEIQRPKYYISIAENLPYKVPPQLNKRELRILGSECNTYGNTLCSHEVFAKLTRLDPRDFYALSNLAMAQTHLGFHKEAIHNFEIAIEHGFKTYDLYKFYGKALMKTNQKEAAIKAYQKSLEIYENQPKLKKHLDTITQ